MVPTIHPGVRRHAHRALCLGLGVLLAATVVSAPSEAAGGPAARTLESVDGRSAACRPQPPLYPGCTAKQAARLEAPDRKTFKKNKHKERWHQGAWVVRLKKKRPAAYGELRDAYNAMVRRYEDKTKTQYPFDNFKDFASHSDCFVPGSGFPSGWCWFNKNVTDKIAEGGAKATDGCGHVMAKFAITSSLTVVVLTAEQYIAAVGLAGAGCMITNAYDHIWSSIFG